MGGNSNIADEEPAELHKEKQLPETEGAIPGFSTQAKSPDSPTAGTNTFIDIFKFYPAFPGAFIAPAQAAYNKLKQ